MTVTDQTLRPGKAAFPVSGGELENLIRDFDWSQTGLGASMTWPQNLKTSIDIILSSPVPMILMWGADGVMIYNDAYVAIAGQRHPGILGTSALVGWPEVADFNKRVLKDVFAGRSLSFKNQHLILHRNGAPEEVWLDLNYSPVLGRSKVPEGVFTVIIETTQQVLMDRRRLDAEESLRDREAELARVQRIGGIGGLEVDLRNGFRNRRSPEYLLIHGLPPDAGSETHEDWVRRIHPDDRVRAEKQFIDAVSGTATDYMAEYRIVRPNDGAIRWIAVNALIERDSKGNALRLVGSHTDITTRKQAQLDLQRLNDTLESTVADRTRELRIAEESLRQAQKMEAIGQLTGGIAHDFNNLLTGIIGSLDILRRRIASGRTGDLDRFMDAAMSSAQRAAGLTQRMLAFSRQQSLDIKPVQLDALLSSLEDLLRRALGESINLKVAFGENLWIVEGDDSQIESALLNLAINARDAMSGGGSLTIGALNVSISDHDDSPAKGLLAGDYVVVDVSDTGTGMSQDVINRAFDPFFTTKPIGLGTGLGLSMVYGYAKQSRGHVAIESEPGQGTSVKLYMRRHHGFVETRAEAAMADVAPAGSGETVLVVEDDPAVRQLVIEILHEAGYSALEAIDGKAALPILESTARIDLMVSDVGLPGLNGRQVAEIGRRLRPDLKVLFITGYAQHAAVRSEFLGPGMEMITKPFQVEALASRIREMIERG